MWQIIDVDATSGYVSCHQCANLATFETSQCLGARRLAFVTVQGHRIDAVLDQKLSNVVGAKLGSCEHEYLAPVVLLDDVRQQCFLLATSDGVNDLRDALYGRVARRDLNAQWALQERCGQIPNFFTESG